MPAKSEKQAIAARIARGIQKGEVKPKAGTASAEMAKMPAKSLKHFTKTESMNTTTNPKFDAMINALATRAKSWKDSEGLYEPEDITYGEFLNFVVDDPKTGPAIKKLWYSLDRAKQDQIFNRVIDVLYSMSENVKFSKMAKEMMGENKSAPLMINGKEVERGSIEVDGVDPKDYPDFSDAYISAANFVDGTPLTDEEIQQLDSENYGLANDLAHGSYLEEGNYSWGKSGELAADRAAEKADGEPSQRGYSGGRGMTGITFFNVPSGKEGEARRLGLTQFKSGKWGFKHRFDKNIISVASDREKSTVNAAELSFGKGRYWEPKN